MSKVCWIAWLAFGFGGVRAGIAICHAVANRGDLGGAVVGYWSCGIWAVAWIVVSLVMYLSDCRRSSRLPG